MKKLVSKNPVQRFKQGRKIEKFSGGGLKTYGGLPIESIENKRGFYTLNGTQYSVPVSLFDTSKDYQFMGTNIGGKVLAKKNNFGDRLTDENKQKLLSSGFFKDSDFSTVQAFQNALNHYFGNDGYGTIKVDNMWGNQTQKAFEEALKKINAPVVNTIEGIQFQNGITPESGISNNSINQNLNSSINSTPNINVQIPTQTYNRTEIRDFLRNKGLNPYLFNGAQRRALRMVMNGQGTDEDKALVQSMGIFKKGGNMLPSRNIIERFKVTKAQKGLKTAPKAKDRFRNGVKDSIAYLGVPGKDNSYFGESIKRVTTPDNAAIQRQILFRHYPHDNDTIYTEVPEHTKRLSIFPQVNIIPRKGFSFAQTPEYETLKRRFNTAWNLAK